LIAMTWLITQKFLPPLLVGEPPSYRTIIEREGVQGPVGWKLQVSRAGAGGGVKECGWALSSTTKVRDEVAEIRSRVHIDDVPNALLQLLKRSREIEEMMSAIGKLKADAQSTVVIDPSGSLVSFDSLLRLPSSLDVRLEGKVEGTKLKLSLSSNKSRTASMEIALPREARLGDALSPETWLPGLHAGQTWNVPSYSTLTPVISVETLTARVEGPEPLFWNGQVRDTLLVVYRDNSGATRGKDKDVRGRLWVHRDGNVLQQEVRILGASITFVRMSDEEAAALAKKIEREREATGRTRNTGRSDSP
jgi:hypothetical protein